jgi:hypothetical protein
VTPLPRRSDLFVSYLCRQKFKCVEHLIVFMIYSALFLVRRRWATVITVVKIARPQRIRMLPTRFQVDATICENAIVVKIFSYFLYSLITN